MASILPFMKVHKKEVMISVTAYIIYSLQHTTSSSTTHKGKCKQKSKQAAFSQAVSTSSTGNVQSCKSKKLNWKHGGFRPTTQLCNCNTVRQQEMAITIAVNSLSGFTLIMKSPLVHLNHTWPLSSMKLFDPVWGCNKCFREGCQNSAVSKSKQTRWLQQISS